MDSRISVVFVFAFLFLIFVLCLCPQPEPTRFLPFEQSEEETEQLTERIKTILKKDIGIPEIGNDFKLKKALLYKAHKQMKLLFHVKSREIEKWAISNKIVMVKSITFLPGKTDVLVAPDQNTPAGNFREFIFILPHYAQSCVCLARLQGGKNKRTI